MEKKYFGKLELYLKEKLAELEKEEKEKALIKLEALKAILIIAITQVENLLTNLNQSQQAIETDPADLKTELIELLSKYTSEGNNFSNSLSEGVPKFTSKSKKNSTVTLLYREISNIVFPKNKKAKDALSKFFKSNTYTEILSFLLKPKEFLASANFPNQEVLPLLLEVFSNISFTEDELPLPTTKN